MRASKKLKGVDRAASRKADARAAYEAQQTRAEASAEHRTREQTAVTAKAVRHLARLRNIESSKQPWDDDLVTDLTALLSQGRADRALAVGLAVTTGLLSWRLSDEELARRLAPPPSTLGSVFQSFVRDQLLPAHRHWAIGERQREAARLRAEQPDGESDPERELRRSKETARRRPIAKRY